MSPQLGHPFEPDAEYPNLCGLYVQTGAPWPAPIHRKCGHTADRHNPQEKEPIMADSRPHSRFGGYTPPVNSEGDEYRPREKYGHAAIVKVLEHKVTIVTSNSPDGAPGVIVDVYDLNDKALYRNVLMMTGAIADGFKPHAGGPPIVVQWEKRVAKNGRDYAFPAPATDAMLTAAEAVYADGDPFLQLGTVEKQEEAPPW